MKEIYLLKEYRWNEGKWDFDTEPVILEAFEDKDVANAYAKYLNCHLAEARFEIMPLQIEELTLDDYKLIREDINGVYLVNISSGNPDSLDALVQKKKTLALDALNKMKKVKDVIRFGPYSFAKLDDIMEIMNE